MSEFSHPYLEWPGPLAIAHRGGTSEFPENTMAAFEHAVTLGFRHLETDVHVTKDGVLVAFHDTDLNRTTGHPGEIIDMTWAEIAELRVDGREPIPLMRDLLERWPDVRFNIDCKADSAVEPLAALVASTAAIDRVCLGSFSHRRLRRLRRLCGPRVLTCLSPPEIASLRILGRVWGSSHRVAQVPVTAGDEDSLFHVTLVNERLVRDAHRAGLAVHVWTIDDEAEMNRLLDVGVDGIMTDHPELLRQVFEHRGIWHQ